MQQFALNALLHESLYAADVSLQNLAASAKWTWFSFKTMSEKCLRLLCICSLHIVEQQHFTKRITRE